MQFKIIEKNSKTYLGFFNQTKDRVNISSEVSESKPVSKDESLTFYKYDPSKVMRTKLPRYFEAFNSNDLDPNTLEDNLLFKKLTTTSAPKLPNR